MVNKIEGVFGKHFDGPVTVDGHVLDPAPSRPVFDHSVGFSWGYSGSGPAQLALAILLHVIGDEERAVKLHQPFKDAFIATLPQDQDFSFLLDVGKWVAEVDPLEDATPTPPEEAYYEVEEEVEL